MCGVRLLCQIDLASWSVNKKSFCSRVLSVKLSFLPLNLLSDEPLTSCRLITNSLSSISVFPAGKKGPYGGVTTLLNAPATAADKAGQAMYLTVSFTRLEISVVDQKPEEVLAATLVGLMLESASGIGQDGSFSSLRFSLSSIQLDDMLPNTRSEYKLVFFNPDAPLLPTAASTW